MTESTAPELLDQDLASELQASLAEMIKLREDLAGLVRQARDDLYQLCDEVTDVAKQVDENQDKLTEKEREITELAERVQETAENKSQREELLRQEQQKSAELACDLESAIGERDESCTKLDAVINEIDSFSSTLELLQSTQDELAQARDELYALKTADDTSESQTLRSELADIRLEREQLNAELSKSVEHIAQLNQTVEQQAAELGTLRKRWADDLNAMRADLQADGSLDSIAEEVIEHHPLGESQAESATEETAVEETAVAETAVEETAEEQEQNYDPVVDSVLAEFQSLES